jgi:hypothetical protein
VVLLCAGLVLIFVGTLAQVHEGLYAAQVRYFKSWYIWRPTIGDSTWPILLPGGYLLGGLLLINLIVAHIKRFQFTTKKLGIQLIHLGLILLLLGQLLTDLLARESSMKLFEGTTRNYSEDFRANELVLVDSSDPKSDQIVSIPESILARKGEIQNAALPVTIRVKNYWPNCDVEEMPPPMAVPVAADHGAYTNFSLLALPETAGDNDAVRSAALVEIVSGGKAVGTYLVPSKEQSPQTFSLDGKQYALSFLFAPMMGGNLLAVSLAGDMGGASMATFPEDVLVKKGELKDDKLPFTIRVKNYWAKCQLFSRPGGNAIDVHANQGMLAGTIVTPEPTVTDTERRNFPGVVVELLNNQGSLGTWLLWATPENPGETISVGNKTYQLAFQFKRYYEPYTISLLKFNHDIYKGTDIPKNFSSRIRLVNPTDNEDREVLIKMNYPLRYRGITYYQASFDERMPKKPATVLQVVKNPGWLTPYLACIMIALGLIIQFMSHLIGFAVKRKNA